MNYHRYQLKQENTNNLENENPNTKKQLYKCKELHYMLYFIQCFQKMTYTTILTS